VARLAGAAPHGRGRPCRAVRDQPRRGGASGRTLGHRQGHHGRGDRADTSATLESRGIRVGLTAHGGVRELAQALHDSHAIPAGAEIFYPTSDAALRQPEHLAAVATLSQRFRVQVKAVYSAAAPEKLEQELAAARAAQTPLGYCFWSPSAIENFGAAQGFQLPAGPVVLVGGSTERCWRERAPPAWRRAFRHDGETPLEWSIRFLERDQGAAGG
jgi:hypothetical protein